MSESQSPKKLGRKQQHFKTSDGNYVNGLQYDEKSKRYRIIGTQKRFRAATETEAVAKFYELTKQGEGVFGNLTADDSDAIDKSEMLAMHWQQETGGAIPFDEWKKQQSKFNFATEAEYWAYTAKMIIGYPQLCSEKTGIEKLAYLTDLKPPKPLPTFKELEAIWKDFAKCSKDQKKKVSRAWDDFKKVTKIKELNDITPEICIAFMDDVHGRELSPKQQKHIFSGIRRMFTFAKSRAVAIDELTKLLGYINLMKPSEAATQVAPCPISKEDWSKLLEAAEGEDRAMILLMLNGAFGISEVINLEWKDLKGKTIVTNRKKTGKCIRACVLWDETFAALEALKKTDGAILRNYQGVKLHRSGGNSRFKKVADAAGVKVDPQSLRDGAQTAAAQGNVSEQLIKIVAGHKTGISDNYIAITPNLTKPAVDAIYAYYFPKKLSDTVNPLA